MEISKNEIGVIGSVILDPDKVLWLASEAGLMDDWFEDPELRFLYRTANGLHQDGKPVDLFTIQSKAKLDEPNSSDRLEMLAISCVDQTPTAEHAGNYIQELRLEHLRRFGRRAASSFGAAIGSSAHPVDDLVCFAGSLLDATAESVEVRKEDIEKNITEKWKNAHSGGVAGVPTPWKSFNRRFGGAHPGCVTLFTGRGGDGKSSAIASWAHYLAAHEGIPTAWLPIEDGNERTYARVAGIHGDFSTFKCDIGESSDEDLAHAAESVRQVLKLPLYLNDKHMSVEQICAWAIRTVPRHGIKILFVDAFKDIMRKKRDLSEDEGISQMLCDLARRLRIPIVVCHHVRKGGLDDKPTDPLTEGDIRGSGLIANDARQIIVLQKGVESIGGVVRYVYWFEIVKNNYGPTGKFPMDRISNRCRWVETPMPDIDWEKQVK